MALESNECQNVVEWGAQELFVKTYIDNLKFFMGNILDEAYQACCSIGLVDVTSSISWHMQLLEQLLDICHFIANMLYLMTYKLLDMVYPRMSINWNISIVQTTNQYKLVESTQDMNQ